MVVAVMLQLCIKLNLPRMRRQGVLLCIHLCHSTQLKTSRHLTPPFPVVQFGWG